MISTGASTQVPPTQQDAAAAVAALATARARLLALALQAGQALEARVLGSAPGGMTRITIAGQTLTVDIPVPPPAGTVMQAQLSLDPAGGQPLLVLRNPGAAPTPVPVSAGASPPVRAPALPAPTPPQIPGTAPPPGTTNAVTSLSAAASPFPAAAQPLPAPPLAAVSTAAPVLTAATPLLPSAPATASPPVLPAPAPPGAAFPPPSAPLPTAVAGASQPALATPGAPSVPVAQAAPAVATTTVATTAVPPLTGAAKMASPQPVAVPATAPNAAPASPTSPPAPPVLAPTAPPPPVPLSARGGVTPTAPTPAAPALAPAPSASSPLPPIPAHAARPPLPLPVQQPWAPPPPAGSAAGIALGQATQAAARQDSIAPLLQNLATLQNRMAQFPRTVAEAALRVLAGRLVLNGSTPAAAQLKQAVLGSGVLMNAPAPASAATTTDLRTGLLQLRSALLGFLGSEIAPVAPVARRPPPPTRDAQLRSLRAEPPTLPEAATPKDAGRVLLHQTDAALSRMRLLQLASLPQDAGRAGAPSAAADWTLEVPMLVGDELAIAQFRIVGDGRNGERKRARSWRLQFSVNFSVLGEVGAQIGFSERQIGIALWAEEPATSAALEGMLPELEAALTARGVKVVSLRVGRRAPQTHRPRAGQLLDGMR